MGGAQYQVKLLTEALVAHGGFEVTIVTNRALVEPGAKLDYKLVTLGSRNGWRRFTYLPDGPELLRTLRQLKPDLIYHRVSCAYTGVCGLYAQQANCRFVWHIAHDWDVSPFDWKFNRLVLFRWSEKKAAEFGVRRATQVFAQSKTQQRLLRQNYGQSSLVMANFHPPVAESKVKRKTFTVLWVANLKTWKRPEAFLRLANSFSHRDDVEFVMIGRAMYGHGKNQQLLQDIKAEKNLTYLGEQPISVVNQWLSKSHVFVNTSKYEGFPNTFVQAWMRHAVVVSLSVDPDHVLSATQPPIGMSAGDDEKQLTAIVERLMEEPKLRDEVAENGAAYAASHHSLEQLEKIVEVLAELK